MLSTVTCSREQSLSKTHAGAPNGTFYGNGLLGQRVIVVPAQELVIVRMGLNFANDFDQVPTSFRLDAHLLHLASTVKMRSIDQRG